MKPPTTQIRVATAVGDELTDNAYIHIPNEARYNQELPKFLADYGLELDSGGHRITIPGPMAEEQAREFSSLLNARADGVLAGMGSTMKLPPRPFIQLPSLVFYPIPIRWDSTMKRRLAKLVGLLVCLYVLYWLGVGFIYMVNHTSTTTGAVGTEDLYGIPPNSQLIVHINVGRQYVLKNFKDTGVILPPDCHPDEPSNGQQAVLICGTGNAGVRAVAIPELRAHRPGTTYYGYTLDYPATVEQIPDDELNDR